MLELYRLREEARPGQHLHQDLQEKNERSVALHIFAPQCQWGTGHLLAEQPRPKCDRWGGGVIDWQWNLEQYTKWRGEDAGAEEQQPRLRHGHQHNQLHQLEQRLNGPSLRESAFLREALRKIEKPADSLRGSEVANPHARAPWQETHFLASPHSYSQKCRLIRTQRLQLVRDGHRRALHTSRFR